MPTPTIFEGINPRGTQTLIPCKDKAAIAWVDAGKSVKKNLVQVSPTVAGTYNNITYTLNADKSITTSNSTGPSALSWRSVCEMELKAGSYILSGCPDGGQTSPSVTYTLALWNITGGSAESVLNIRNNGGDTPFTLENDITVQLNIGVGAGQVIGTKIFKPMIRFATILDDTYAPYIPDNTELLPRSEQEVLGAKNQNFTIYKSGTKDGVTWTANADNSVSISGRTSASETEVTVTPFEAPFTGQVKFCGGISNECHIYPWSATDNARPYTDSTKTARQTGTSKAIDDALPIYIEKGKKYILIPRIVGNNLDVSGTFYPMLVLDSETDLSYVAPAMTNKELTDKKLEPKYINSAIDLDNITESGMYLVTNISTINRPANTPNMFTLFVMKFSDSYIQQMVIETTGTLERIYTRRYGGNPLAWSSWYVIEGTVVS